MEVKKCACRGCHGGCLYDVTVDDGKVVKVRPSKDGPLNKGRGCIKGMTIIEQMYHPDRLLYPQRRIGPRGAGTWERISWDEAFDLIATRMNELIDTYGPECITTMTGTGRHHLPYITRLANAIGTPNRSSAGTLICYGPRRTAAWRTSGILCSVDYYGEVKPGGLLVWGHNPAISGPDGELQWNIKDAVKGGTPIIVIDPQYTELAQQAHIWMRIRPGTDCLLALAFLRILIDEDLYDHDFVDNYCYGFKELTDCVREYDLDFVSEMTTLPKEQIIEAAHWIASTKPLGLEYGCAFEQNTNCFDTCRAIFMIPAITGNYDVPGGFVESKELAPAISPPPNKLSDEVVKKTLDGGCVFTAHQPMAHPWYMMEAIRTGEPFKIRGMFTHANNTLMSFADSKHTYECLKELDFFVYMDIFMTPTAELADVVLPAALWPEVNCFFSMPEFVDSVVLSQQKLVQVGECMTDEDFFFELCRRAGWNYGADKIEDIQQWQIDELVRRRPELEGLTIESLREKGFVDPERYYYKYKTRGFLTPTKKFELYSTMMEAEGGDPLPHWRTLPESKEGSPELYGKYPLILITGGRKQEYFISNGRQIKTLRKMAPFPLVKMHPDTAAKYGIEEGDWVWIENQRGRITQKAKLVPQMDPNVVNCDFAWWYPEAGPPGYGWDESNANVLTSAGPELDPYMGAYTMRSLLCKIYKNENCTIEERYHKWMDQEG